jgi:uncharacterized membrane protein YtjA (UPF0391 family)
LWALSYPVGTPQPTNTSGLHLPAGTGTPPYSESIATAGRCDNSPTPAARTQTRKPANAGQKEIVMLHYAVVFFVIALIAALFGFGGIAAGAAGIAKILFFVFVIMAVITFVMSLLRKG